MGTLLKDKAAPYTIKGICFGNSIEERTPVFCGLHGSENVDYFGIRFRRPLSVNDTKCQDRLLGTGVVGALAASRGLDDGDDLDISWVSFSLSSDVRDKIED